MKWKLPGSGDVTPDSLWERTVFEKRVFKILLVSVYSDRNELEQTTDTKLWVVIS